MGIYLNDEITTGLHVTNAIITENTKAVKNLTPETTLETKDRSSFFLTVLSLAWSDFYNLAQNDPKKLDANTQFNQENIETSIMFTSHDYNHDRIVFLSNLLRVLFEFYFWTGMKKSQNYLSYDSLTTLDNLFGNSDKINVQFSWIRDIQQISLMQWLINSEHFIETKHIIKNIDSKRDNLIQEISQRSGIILSEVETAKKHSVSEIEGVFKKIKEDVVQTKKHADDGLNYISDTLVEVKALEKKIQDLRAEYNFVGLSSGFNKIKEKKESELQKTEMNYKNLFGCIFIAPVLVAISHFALPNLYPKDYSAIFLILPFFTVEMILIYFFRLSYLEAKSLRTQLVQIELRVSLCAFIDGYVEYRKKNNTTIEKVLDNFDSLIFSPIQTNENNIPAMFDGVEALAGLADKLIKK